MPGSFQDQDVDVSEVTFPGDGNVNQNATVSTSRTLRQRPF